MNKIQSILIASTLLTTTACSSIPNVFKVDAAPVERPPLVLPDADTFAARGVEWIVITPENADAKFKELQDSGKEVVVFALTEDGWKNLSLNMADLLKLVQQQKAIIAAYEKYYVNQ